jgi:hypothetical protein
VFPRTAMQIIVLLLAHKVSPKELKSINAYFHCFEQVLIFNKRLQRSVASHYCGQSGGTGGHYS